MKITLDGPNLKYIAIAIVCALLAIAAWFYFKPVKQAPGSITQATEASAVKGTPKETISGKIEVYHPAAAKKLGIPIAANSRVVAASTVRPDLHPKTVITLIDQDTGKTSTIVKTEPDPWLAAENTREIRFSYGIKRGDRIGRLTFTDDLIQVKALHAGATASLDSDGSFFYGVSIAYRF